MIPLITSWLRRGFAPRRFIGIAASIAVSCSLVSQNRFDIDSFPQLGSVESGRPESGQAEIGLRA